MGLGKAESSARSAGDTGDGSSELDSLLRQVAQIPDTPPRAPEPDRTGQKLAHFRIRSKLGQGGMGIVYEADDTKLRRKVALKVLPMAMVADEERRRRFLREARSVSAVLHPNLAAVFDVGEADGTVFLAMEHVDGITLRQHLDQRGGRLDAHDALRIVREIARGLGKAHGAGVVHRDLKPENVMIATDGTVKVLDFGLAKLDEIPDLEVDAGDDPAEREDLASRVGKVLGTPGYMSPEQASGAEVDARTDVFSFGVMLYELLTGVRPFRGGTTRELLHAIEREDPPSIREVARDVPGALVRIVDRCLRKNHEERFLDGAALLEELDRAHDEIAAAPRSRAIRMTAVAALAVAGGLAIWLGTRAPTEPPAPEAAAVPPTTSQAAAPPAAPSETMRDPLRPVDPHPSASVPSAPHAPAVTRRDPKPSPSASAPRSAPTTAPAPTASGLQKAIVGEPPF